jgi:hypothetical protein
MKRFRWLAVLAAGLSLAACTHISTLPDRQVTVTKRALTGVSYALPMLQYDLTVSRSLVTCPTVVDLGGVGATDATLSFNVEASATSRYVPGEIYVIDYESLSSWFKTSTFALERHPNGTLKSLNATAVDQSADVIKDTVKTGILVSSLGAGGPISATGAALSTSQNVSAMAVATENSGKRANKSEFNQREQIYGALAEQQARASFWQRRSDLLARLVKASLIRTQIVACQSNGALATAMRAANRDESKDRTAELANLNRTIANQTVLANLKALNRDGRERLGKLFEDQEQLIIHLAKLDEDLVDIDKALTLKDQKLWPTAFDSDLQEDRQLSTSQKKKLEGLLEVREAQILDPMKFAQVLRGVRADDRLRLIKDYPKELAGFIDKFGAVIPQTPESANCQGPTATVAECSAEKLRVTTALIRAETGRAPCAESPGDEEECLRNLPSKPPADANDPVIIKARDSKPDAGIFVRDPALARLVVCRDTTCSLGSRSLVTVDVTYAPQLGQLRFLPFSNEIFESNALSVALSDDGKLQKIEYKRDKAVAATLAATAADVAGQLRTEQKRLEQQAKDDITYGRSERAAERTEAAAIRTEAAAIRGEPGAALQAQIDYLTKEAALKKLQTPETPDEFAAQNEEIARLNKETAVLTARRLRYEAIVAADKLGFPTD